MEITTPQRAGVDRPAQRPNFNGLSERQRKEHRARVSIRADAILDGFWRDDDGPAKRALVLEGWADVLQGFTESEIRKAWAEYQKTGPRAKSGRLMKPDAGAIYRIAYAARPRPAPEPPAPEPERKRVSPERAQEMTDELKQLLRGAG
jgi:hypothetical protein